jgi:hypothetical protein
MRRVKRGLRSPSFSFVNETFCCYEDDNKEWEGTKKNGRRGKNL